MSLKDHSAPGAAAAFSYQFERAMHWLAQSQSGCRIGIETCDDVSAHNADGIGILEQDKHTIRADGLPFGDRSKDLWNTLAIWLGALVAQEISADSTAFLLVTNKVLPDCLAKRIGEAKTAEEIDQCIAELREAAKNPPEGIVKLCGQVLEAKHLSYLKGLIFKIELVDGSGGASLRAATIGLLSIPDSYKDSADSIADELLGWIHKEALLAWQTQQPAWIARDHFVNRLHAALEQRRRRVQRERSEHLLPVPAGDVGKELGRPFVRQLHLITEDDSVVDNAIKDFLRCTREKLRLSREGNITDDDWLAFEATLKRRWEAIQARVKRNSAQKNTDDIGWEIYTDTTEDHREKLAGQDTEQYYLTSGSYHQLADLLDLGWHPEWRKLMKEASES